MKEYNEAMQTIISMDDIDKLSKNKRNYQIIDSNLSIGTNKKSIINKIEKLIR